MRGLGIAGLAVLALLAAGCGAGTTVETQGKLASSLAYARCMRSHGVESYPDPKQVGGGIQISGSRSPTFLSAQQLCRRLLPGGGTPTRAHRQEALTRMLHISQCMRAHGIPGFPDPTLSAPAGRAGFSSVMSNGIAFLAIPSSIDVRSHAFGQAAAACSLGLSP